MSKPDQPKMPYWKKLCLELRMSEDEVAALLAKNPAEQTEFLIAMFTANPNSNERAAILSILSELGDVEIAGNFLIDILESGTDRLKFCASVQGRMIKFDSHFRLRKAIKAHLQGKTAAEVWIRNAFPDGCCPPRKRVPPPIEKAPAKTNIRKISRTPLTVLSFPKSNKD